MKIQKTNNYLVGTSSATQIIGKEKKLEFDEGKVVEVTEEQGAIMLKNGWAVEVKDGE